MSDIEPPIVPLSPREKRAAYSCAAVILLSLAVGWAAATSKGSAAYWWTGVAVAVAIHAAFTIWIARAHHLPFWPTFLLRLDRRA